MMDIYKLNLGIRLAIALLGLALAAMGMAHIFFAGKSTSPDGG
ncbi:hypothetical protein [Acidianus sp. HS-5]|nr:hypothetical protein [Acidianus sp. HS-5]BDC17701.1 hypothetical protein HS5_05910 [Acidianus sp. HS-5]